MKNPKDRWINRIWESVGRRALENPHAKEKLQEVLNPEFSSLSSGIGIDPDDHLFRRLSQQHRDFSPHKLDRAIHISYYLNEVNPLFQRLINMPIEAIQSAGFSLKTDNDKIKELWTDFYDKPSVGYKHFFFNDWREIKLSGEGNWPVGIGETTGQVELAYLSPLGVKAIRLLPGNARVSDKILQGNLADGKPGPIWDIIRPRQGILDGTAFHFPIHKPTGGTRGRPHLFALFDMLDLYDQSTFNEAERWLHLKSYLWDMELEGKDEDEMQKFVKKMFPRGEMKSGSIFAHNDKVKLEAKTPDLKAADGTAMSSMIRRGIVGGAGQPDWAFGHGDDVNRSTAEVMQDPFTWMIEGEQGEGVNILTTFFAFQLQQFVIHGKMTTKGRFTEADLMDSWEVIANNVLPRAFVQNADAFQSLVTSFSVAKSQGIIGLKTAQQQYVRASNEIGFELTLQEVQDELKEEASNTDDLGNLSVGAGGITDSKLLDEKVKESKHVKKNGSK